MGLCLGISNVDSINIGPDIKISFKENKFGCAVFVIEAPQEMKISRLMKPAHDYQLARKIAKSVRGVLHDETEDLLRKNA